MATGTAAQVVDFIGNLGSGVHDLTSNALTLALSNTAPASESSNPLAAGNGVIGNVTPIAYTNYSDDMTVDRVLENVSFTQSGGTWTLAGDNIVVTASGGALPDFQYIYVYDDDATSDEIIAHWALDSAISLADGESETIQFDASGITALAPAA